MLCFLIAGHAAACSWFAELGAYLRAQALTDDFPNPPAPSPPRAKKEKKREPPVLPEPVFENERSLAEVYKEELTRLYAEFNPSKVTGSIRSCQTEPALHTHTCQPSHEASLVWRLYARWIKSTGC